jgi:aryl-alcohol dehydrogenase-like predicted oxidoreductase
MIAVLEACGARVVASAVLAFGALTGRGRTGRARDVPDDERWQSAFAAGEQLVALGRELSVPPVQLAIVFALANPRVASVLFGASRAEQVQENAGALELLGRLGDAELAELRGLAG